MKLENELFDMQEFKNSISFSTIIHFLCTLAKVLVDGMVSHTSQTFKYSAQLNTANIWVNSR